jgi:hypothetical protein
MQILLLRMMIAHNGLRLSEYEHERAQKQTAASLQD